MRITFNGAARTVTGSQYLLEANGSKVLMECGLFQGRRADTYTRNRTFRFSPSALDAVLLSHAHIDHSGNLPNLVKQGFEGRIYATRATSSLSGVMLMDSGHIQEADVEFINKRRARRGEPPAEPLYTQVDASRTLPHFHPVEYNQAFEAAPGVVAEFFDAGHILGSAGMQITVTEGSRTTRLWFSGDIGRPGLPIVRDPVLPREADYLVMECTYGDTHHDDPELSHREFAEVIRRVIERRGKVIIPAFAVGRTQDLVFTLNQLISEKFIPSIPVFVDSPLAVQASQVFIRHPECFDAETNTFIQEHRHPALNFPNLTYVGSVAESKAINDLKGPLVIISASGMAETGRILHHLKNNLDDPRNVVLIVSWQAPETLGRRLADGAKVARIFGEEYPVHAEVKKIAGLSAHAGQDGLLRYAHSLRGRVREIFLVHGEPDAAAVFRSLLDASGLEKVHYPDWQDVVDLAA